MIGHTGRKPKEKLHKIQKQRQKNRVTHPKPKPRNNIRKCCHGGCDPVVDVRRSQKISGSSLKPKSTGRTTLLHPQQSPKKLPLPTPRTSQTPPTPNCTKITVWLTVPIAASLSPVSRSFAPEPIAPPSIAPRSIAPRCHNCSGECSAPLAHTSIPGNCEASRSANISTAGRSLQ